MTAYGLLVEGDSTSWGWGCGSIETAEVAFGIRRRRSVERYIVSAIVEGRPSRRLQQRPFFVLVATI